MSAGGGVSREVVEYAFRAFVGDPKFPCLAGKGVVNSNGHELGIYGALGLHRNPRPVNCRAT